MAYHKARAEGGVGLIIMQVAGVHETARYTSHLIMATTDDCIPGYQDVVAACKPFGTKIFGQLFHPGREIMESQDGTAPVAYAPSAIPNERFHVMPRRMSKRMIKEIIEGYADAAVRLQKGHLDGVEIVASHAYLPAQFLKRAHQSSDRRVWWQLREPAALHSRGGRGNPRQSGRISSSACASAVMTRTMTAFSEAKACGD